MRVADQMRCVFLFVCLCAGADVLERKLCVGDVLFQMKEPFIDLVTDASYTISTF